MDGRLKIHCGDCRDILPTLEAGSVQCCVTSPPYWRLRDYGTAQWEGGEETCDHLMPVNGVRDKGRDRAASGGTFHDSPIANQIRQQFAPDCPKCGARRIDAQLGLESTPEEYIANMVAVFRDVWRVLRDDGTLWVNLGDSYASPNGWRPEDQKTSTLGPKRDGLTPENAAFIPKPKRRQVQGLKPKDLCMMPARLAMALQASYSKCDECGKESGADSRRCERCGRRSPTIYPGWYLRSEIVWHKPNPMPESVTDRPTKAHEMIYLLAKRERYFYDAEAIREPSVDTWNSATSTLAANGIKNVQLNQMGQRRTAGADTFHRDEDRTGRNKRSVWTIATQPYAEAHFATFPEQIPKLCILAGSKPGDTVLDPFAGSGTVGKVALELGRKAILIELNPEYVRLIKVYTAVTVGWF